MIITRSLLLRFPNIEHRCRSLPETYNEPPNTPTYALGSRPRALKSAAKTES